MNKFLVLALSLVYVSGIVWAENTTSNASDTRIINIGFVAPLSGPFAEWGTSLKNGMEIAVAHTKHRFQVDYEDDGCESTKALSIGQKFIAIDGINLIIGPGCLNGLEALAPLAEKKGDLLPISRTLI